VSYDIALGTMRVSGFFNGLLVLDRKESRAKTVLQRAIATGIDLIDTAPIYARGLAESDIGAFAPRVRVWTKVGVDISRTLPELNYTVSGMLRSLRGSLERLRRDGVEAVFIQNPPQRAIASLDIPGFLERCRASGYTDTVGLSLLRPSDVRALSPMQLPEGVPLMLEAGMMNEATSLIASLAQKHSVVIRSPFAGGRVFDGVAAAKRPEFVAAELNSLAREWRPSAIVIGPRTPGQLRDYVTVKLEGSHGGAGLHTAR